LEQISPSLRAGTQARTDATPGTALALIHSYLLASHLDGLSPHSSSLPATSVLRSMRKRADSPVALCSVYKNPPPVHRVQSLRLCTLMRGRFVLCVGYLDSEEAFVASGQAVAASPTEREK